MENIVSEITTLLPLSDIVQAAMLQFDDEAAIIALDEAKRPAPAIPTQAEIQAEAEKATAVKQARIAATLPAVIVLSEPQHVEGDLKRLLAEVSIDQVAESQRRISAAFAERASFETMKDPTNINIQDNLTQYGKQMGSMSAATLFEALSIDPEFINRSISKGKRFNVYGVDKANDLIMGMTAGFMKKAPNIAILKSMFKFKEEGLPFTPLMACAAVSQDIKVDAKFKALLTRHTVKANTAPTQSSSTMNALEVLGVVQSVGKGETENWMLTDTPQTRRLQEVLMAA